MSDTLAILSLLHESPTRNSATRIFRDRPVLAWTLDRLAQSNRIKKIAILCWEDQKSAIQSAIGNRQSAILSHPRAAVPGLDAITASRRWADGWRGGLLSACEFDRGFHAPWVCDLASQQQADAVLLVDPAAAMVDPVLIDSILAYGEADPDQTFCFSPAAPGLAGVILRPTLIEKLATAMAHPGQLLCYNPDTPIVDPILSRACVSIPTPLARTMHRFTLDSDRQIARACAATAHLNGQLASTDAATLLAAFDGMPSIDSLPCEVVIELTPARRTRPVFSPARHLSFDRAPLSVALVGKFFSQLAAADDTRITFAGAGDPLLHPDFFSILDAARHAGITALHAETDLVDLSPATIEKLAACDLDILSVHLPATNSKTYEMIMGVDAMPAVMESLRLFLQARKMRSRGTPILVPTFMKCRDNQGEMENWYDHWIRTVGCAVIAGPSDFAGQVPDVAVADMSPPKRIGCRRLSSRLTILSDGTVVSCEQDVLGKQPLGRIDQSSLTEIWNNRMASLRADHAAGQWNRHPLCANCREWHRP